uniref:Chemoattractive glycoprotein ES20 n=1 Tax=Lumbricus terrestris TaxID=6398 RepID=O44335_LUMTE|nr:chemoattractive glycoprotein ES20 [Lumbricus terrestris]
MKTYLLLVFLVGAHALVCPPGFTYLPAGESCYKVIFESHDWHSATERCRQESRGLAAISTPEESIAVKEFIDTEISKDSAGAAVCHPTGQSGIRFWTSGLQTKDTCTKTSFLLKITNTFEVPFDFTNWADGEPTLPRKTEKFSALIVGSSERTPSGTTMTATSSCVHSANISNDTLKRISVLPHLYVGFCDEIWLYLNFCLISIQILI